MFSRSRLTRVNARASSKTGACPLLETSHHSRQPPVSARPQDRRCQRRRMDHWPAVLHFRTVILATGEHSRPSIRPAHWRPNSLFAGGSRPLARTAQPLAKVQQGPEPGLFLALRCPMALDFSSVYVTAAGSFLPGDPVDNHSLDGSSLPWMRGPRAFSGAFSQTTGSRPDTTPSTNRVKRAGPPPAWPRRQSRTVWDARGYR